MSDELLRTKLEQVSNGDETFWSFSDHNQRTHAHSFFQYPAMMVPQMQQVLLDVFKSVDPNIKRVTDPFAGSGTVLTEAMFSGLDFTAQDINPLAILLCKTKSGPLDIDQLRNDITDIKASISQDQDEKTEADFPKLSKWFTKDVIKDLSKIRRAIAKIPQEWRRRFFWVALADTIRLSSNSRTSNFKLYTYPQEVIAKRNISSINIFYEIIERNLSRFDEQRQALESLNLVKDNAYTGDVEVLLGNAANPIDTQNRSDLLVTSPPYGDNSTTVSYGQYSYLPLQWIELSDIDQKVNEEYLRSSQEIDSRSLGGSKANARIRAAHLMELSPSFRRIMQQLENEPEDRMKRVASFCSDLEKTIAPILNQLKPNAYMVWITGNRQVSRQAVPLNSILKELLEAHNAKFVIELSRQFPSHTKRMANLTNTMPNEHILIMRKDPNGK